MIEKINFGFRNRLPIQLQVEASECGLSCMAMIAAFHGHHVDMRVLRQKYPVSLKGSGLKLMIKVASALRLSPRPLRAELHELHQLRMPCVLHWNMNHFVVLKQVKRNFATIHDPAHGVRRIALSELSESFTGVALEVWPTAEFVVTDPVPSVRLRELVGRVVGIRRSLASILTFALALEVFAIVTPFFSQWVLDDVIVSGDQDLLITLCIAFLLLLLVQQAVGAARAWAVAYMATNISVQWRSNVFTHLLNLPIQFFERRHLGDVVSRFGAVDSIQQTLTTTFLSAVLDGLMTIVTLALMLLYSPKLAAISIIAMALYVVGRAVRYGPMRSATEAQIVRSAKTQSHFLETVRGIRAIQLFQRRDERRHTWQSLLVEQVNASVKIQRMQIFFQQWNGLVFGVEGVLILGIGATMVLAGEFTVGMLMAFNAYKSQFNSRVGGLIDSFFEVKMLQVQALRLADIVLTAPEEAPSMREDFHAGNLEGTITLRSVEYRYAHGEPTIIKNLTLSIGEGESVAIVGASGCGKTTLINLILGILKPTQGEVLIGGLNSLSVGHSVLRSIMGTVLQDDSLFAGSVSENISFGDINHDQKWAEECAKVAGIHFEILSMPMGYATLVGDMGTVLSGGQKQRVLIARALYKRPKILVLDEATSQLDVVKEQLINAAIKELNITRLIVAHRPQTIASVGRVIRLDDGRVVKDGPPDEEVDLGTRTLPIQNAGRPPGGGPPKEGVLA